MGVWACIYGLYGEWVRGEGMEIWMTCKCGFYFCGIEMLVFVEGRVMEL
jgi:hypothetical protein